MPIDESLKFLPVNIAVLTVSDTRDMASDRSGQTLQDRIEAARHHCVAREIVKDDPDAIEAVLRRWIAEQRHPTTPAAGAAPHCSAPDPLDR